MPDALPRRPVMVPDYGRTSSSKMGSEWVFPFLTRLAPPHRKTHSDPIFAPRPAGRPFLAPSYPPDPAADAASEPSSHARTAAATASAVSPKWR